MTLSPTPTETLPPQNLSVDIHPIQVVQDPPAEQRQEDLPLVQDKATMVRVFVTGNVPDGTIIRDVAAELRTGDGAVQEITADLHFQRRRALVVPVAERAFFDAGTSPLVSRYSALFYDAYNFEFPNGHGVGTSGTLPRQDPFAVSVVLHRGVEPVGADNEVFALRRFTDADGNGRRRLSFHFVETPDRMLHDRPGTAATDAALSSMARQQLDGLIALFPVPHTQVEMVVDLGAVHMLPGTTPADVSTFLSRFFLAALGADTLVDRFVLVVPGPTANRRSVAGDIYIDAGGTALNDAAGLAPRDVRGTVFIVENPGRFTTAHEDTHQLDLRYGGRDREHHDGLATDGWEVRRTLGSPFRKLVSEPHISFMRGPLSAGILRLSLWAARDDYEQLLQKLTAGGSGGRGQSGSGGGAALFSALSVFVVGHRELDGTIQLAPFFTSDTPAVDVPSGDLTARAVATNGRVLAERSFGVDSQSSDDPGSVFGFHLPFPRGTARIEIARHHKVLARRHVSATPPALRVLTFAEVANAVYRITLEATDADGDALTLAAAYTPDAERFLPLQIDEASDGQAFEFDASGLPGSVAGQVRVTVTDGVHTARAFSPPLPFPDRQPAVAILSPANGGVIATAAAVTLRGHAYDPEDGILPDGALSWHSDLDGPLGTGEQVLVPSLSPGHHLITLSAADSGGTRDAAAHTITVLPNRATPDLVVTELMLVTPPQPPCRDVTVALRLALAGTDAVARVALFDPEGRPHGRPLVQQDVLLFGNESREIPLTARLRGRRERQLHLVARAELLDVEEPNTQNNVGALEVDLPRLPRGKREGYGHTPARCR